MTSVDNPRDITPGVAEYDDKLYVECVQIAYRRRKHNLISHIIVSALPLYLGWATDAWLINIILLSLIWIYTVIGYYTGNRFTATENSNNATLWATYLYIQLAILGILYNMIFMNLAFSGINNAMIYLLLTTALFSAGGVSSYQNLKWLGPLFVITAMTPQCIFYLVSPDMGDSLMAFLIAIFIVFMTGVGLNLHKEAIHTLSLNYELVYAKEKAEKLARTDELTTLKNRRAFFDEGQVILSNARRYKHPLSIVMLDIDRFKVINDTYGHAAGDEVLRKVANILKQGIRESDISGRLGGEEFALILQETSLMVAQELTERLRKEIEQVTIESKGQKIQTTASFGIAEFAPECSSLEEIIIKADRALYQAKNEGRNRVAISTE